MISSVENIEAKTSRINREQNTRELVGLAKDGQAKNLLTQIAETYERLARPQ